MPSAPDLNANASIPVFTQADLNAALALQNQAARNHLLREIGDGVRHQMAAYKSWHSSRGSTAVMKTVQNKYHDLDCEWGEQISSQNDKITIQHFQICERIHGFRIDEVSQAMRNQIGVYLRNRLP